MEFIWSRFSDRAFGELPIFSKHCFKFWLKKACLTLKITSTHFIQVENMLFCANFIQKLLSGMRSGMVVTGERTLIRRQKISQTRLKEIDFNNGSFENKWLSETLGAFNI